MTPTQQILDKFVASVNVNENYSIADLVNLLKTAYKPGNKKYNSNGEVKVKKAPSAYNIFIKEQMELLKNDGTSPKDRMRQATANWNKMKTEKNEKTEDVKETNGSESSE
jgi:hypothetical protein